MASNGYTCIMPNVGQRAEVLISAAYCDKEEKTFVVWGQFDFHGVEEVEVALAKLTDVAQRKEFPRGELFPGNLCLAKSIQDNQWYRASIQTATGNDVLAFFIDNGNTEFVPRTRIRKIDESLYVDAPAMATKCVLMGIQPVLARSSIKSGTLDYLDRLIVNKSFLCEVMGKTEEYLLVKMYSINGNRDVCAQFVLDSFAEPATQGMAVAHPQPQPLVGQSVPSFTFMGMDVGHRDRVYVSNILSPTRFWVQQEVIAVDLDDLMNDLQAYFVSGKNNVGATLTNATEGMSCIAKFSEDDQYYRAVITKVGVKECDVLFVDYGNTERTSVSALRNLPAQFAKLPGAAIEAQLSSIDPDSCQTIEATDRFEELTSSKVLCCKIDGKVGAACSMQMIDPRDDDNLSISEILIKENLAKRSDQRKIQAVQSPSESHKSSSRNSSRRASSSRSPESPRPPESKPLRTPSLKVNTKHSVTVTAIRSSCDFSCQLLADSAAFEELTEKLQNDYSTKGLNDSAVQDMQLGMTCCAQFTEDEFWYRAEVVFVKDKTAEVMFVDYGNSDMVPFSRIKYLDARYSNMMAQSVQCRLEGVEDIPGHSSEIKRKFEDLVGENEHIMRICKRDGDIYFVDMVEGKTGESINEEMKKFCETFKQHRRGTEYDTFSCEDYSKLKFASGEKIKMYVSNVDSPNLFYCQPVSSAEDLQAMMDELNSHIGRTSPRGGLNIQLQTPCAAKFSEDETWYRATVTGLKRSGDTEVLFVDYGNHDTVKAPSLRPLHGRFLRLPIQGVACSLSGVPSKSWTDEEINKLFELTGEEQLEVVFGGKESDKYEVTLMTSKGICLNEHFQPVSKSQDHKSNQATPPHQSVESTQSKSLPEQQTMISYVERELKIGTSVNVYISHVDSLSEFWCQPDFTTSDLEQLMNEIYQIYGNPRANQKVVKNPSLGKLCVAQFTEDNNWYRGIIVNKSLNRIQVCFVDYGNKEDVPINRLREIDQKVLKTPLIAVKCCLKGAAGLENPERVKRLKDLVDEVDHFSCKIMTSANGVYEVELKCDNGKQVTEILKSVVEKKEVKTAQQNKMEVAPKQTQPSPPRNDSQGRKDATRPQHSTSPVNETKPLPKRESVSQPASVQLQSIVESVKDDFIDVVLSYITSPARFWIQLLSSCAHIDSLMEKLNDMAVGEKLTPLPNPISDQLCIAKSPTDEACYRARVLRQDADQFEIHYVDYGNTEFVGKESLYVLSMEFQSLPSQAVECSLSGVNRTMPFTDGCIDAFSALALEKQLVLKAVKRQADRLVVDLMDTTGEKDVNINQEMSKVIAEAKVPSLPLTQMPDSGNVFITQVEQSGAFYIQFESATETLEQLHADIQTAYGAADVLALTKTEVGQHCCGVFSEDGEWYRGVVESIDESGGAMVRFIDYGNASSCIAKELKELLPQFQTKPTLAHCCHLHDVVMTGTIEFVQLLEELTLEKELVCEFKDKEEPYQVTLTVNGVNINQAMTKKFRQNTVKSTAKPEKVPKPPLPKDWVFRPLDVGKKLQVYVSCVTNPNHFFCQPSDVTEKLDTLLNEFNSIYNASRPELEIGAQDLRAGSICMAKFPADESWYRAEVLNLTAQGVTVLFPDYGNAEVISLSNIKRMLPEHAKLEINAVCCSLSNVTYTGKAWSDQAYEAFATATINKLLLAEVVGVPKKDCRSANLAINSIKLLDMGMNVADKLIEGGHAQLPGRQNTRVLSAGSDVPISQVEAPNVQYFPGYLSHVLSLGTTENVFITAITSLNNFCLQLGRLTDEVESFCAQVDEFYTENKVPSLRDVKPGVTCAVKCSDDDVWYRAVVDDVRGQEADVTFVDYGNGDTVHLSQVKEMKEQFLQTPAFACRCALAGIDASKATDEALLQKFEDLLDIETLTAEVVGASGGTLSVRIWDGEVSICETIGVEENIEPVIPTSNTKMVDPSITTRMYTGYSNYDIPAGLTENIFLTSVASLADFSVQLGRHADEVSALTALVDEYYKNNVGEVLKTVDIGASCVAQYTEDEVWYRAEVRSVEDGNAEVLFVDYGNADSVAVSSLKQLEEQFKDNPAYSLRCQLVGMEAERCADADNIEKFLQYLDSETLVMKVFGSEGGKLLVQVLEGDSSVVNLIGLKENLDQWKVEQSEKDTIHQNSAMFPGYAIQDTPLDLTEPIFITSATSLTDFCVQFSKQSSEVADFTAQFHEHYESISAPAVSEVSVGSVCAAKYSEDDTWYRACIDALHDSEADVTFVDYGNTDTLSISTLKTLDEKFLAQPAYAMRCRLAGITQADSEAEDHVNKFLEFLDNENLVMRLVRVDRHQLAVQLLEGEESIASKLGLEEDLAQVIVDELDETSSELNTTAHDLAEDALSAALRDLEDEVEDDKNTDPSESEEKSVAVAEMVVDELIKEACQDVGVVSLEEEKREDESETEQSDADVAGEESKSIEEDTYENKASVENEGQSAVENKTSVEREGEDADENKTSVENEGQSAFENMTSVESEEEDADENETSVENEGESAVENKTSVESEGEDSDEYKASVQNEGEDADEGDENKTGEGLDDDDDQQLEPEEIIANRETDEVLSGEESFVDAEENGEMVGAEEEQDEEFVDLPDNTDVKENEVVRKETAEYDGHLELDAKGDSKAIGPKQPAVSDIIDTVNKVEAAGDGDGYNGTDHSLEGEELAKKIRDSEERNQSSLADELREDMSELNRRHENTDIDVKTVGTVEAEGNEQAADFLTDVVDKALDIVDEKLSGDLNRALQAESED